MAVEARHLNLFRPPILDNQGLMLDSDQRNIGAQMPYAPLSGITTATDADASFPIYCSTLAEAFPPTLSRKRSRESVNPMLSSFPSVANNNRCASFNFLGEDITLQIHQQRMEMDRFISHHAEKVRMETEERQRIFSQRIAAAVKENMMNTVKAKQEQVEKMGKLNRALEERVKSLSIENQIWRDLAHSNEAKANALRSDLEQVLAQVQQDQQADHDAESCCGSSSEGDKQLSPRGDRICRNCGKQESCVVILPCRHLCLCTACGSSLHACPVCHSITTASLHVNLSR